MTRHANSGPTSLIDLRVCLRIQDAALATAAAAALRGATLQIEASDATSAPDTSELAPTAAPFDALVIDDAAAADIAAAAPTLPPHVAWIVVLADATPDIESVTVRWIGAGAQAVVPAQALASCLGRDVLQAVLRARLRSRLLRACDEADRLALRDPLTGLLNRRGLERGLRADAACTVMLADIDAFKGVNDAHGHHIGDAVLQRVGAALQGACRATDLVARVGGDEFLVVLDTDDGDFAAAIAERMRAQVAAIVIPTESGPIQTSVSVGVVRVLLRELDVSALLRRCRAALRQSKQGGRNGVTMSIDR